MYVRWRRHRRLLPLWRGCAAALLAAGVLVGYLLRGQPRPFVGPSAAPLPLMGTAWHLTAYRDAGGRWVQAGPYVGAWATFTQHGSISGNAGCSDFEASYTTRALEMSISGIALAANGCGWSAAWLQEHPEARATLPDLHAVEGAFLVDLQEAAGFRLTDRHLRLSAAMGTPLLAFLGTLPVVSRPTGT